MVDRVLQMAHLISLRAKASPETWTMQKCACGHHACNQYTISTMGEVGFSKEDAEFITEASRILQGT